MDPIYESITSAIRPQPGTNDDSEIKVGSCSNSCGCYEERNMIEHLYPYYFLVKSLMCNSYFLHNIYRIFRCI